jgi:hypothetical protein
MKKLIVAGGTIAAAAVVAKRWSEHEVASPDG